jgi:hypothetical protein
MIPMTEKKFGVLSLPVIVAALGYFVDIYDLLIFSIVREPSLKALLVPDAEIVNASAKIINWQMFGLLLGCQYFSTPPDGRSPWLAAFWPCGRLVMVWFRPSHHHSLSAALMG